MDNKEKPLTQKLHSLKDIKDEFLGVDTPVRKTFDLRIDLLGKLYMILDEEKGIKTRVSKIYHFKTKINYLIKYIDELEL